MEYAELVIQIVSGLVIGFFIGLTGIGGGVLVMPALTLLLKLPASVAVGTASLYALITKVYAVFEHFRLKTIDLKVSLFFLIGAVPGNIITSVLINRYISRNSANRQLIDSFQNNLKFFIACVLLVAVGLMILQVIRARGGASAGVKSMSGGRKAAGILLGALVGALIGSTSVGGGVIIIPLLIIFFGLSTEKTVGTSIFIAVVLVLSTSIIYSSGGQIDWRTAAIMAVSSFLGVYAGSRLSVRMPEKILKVIVSSLILAAAILMLTTGIGH